MHMVVRVIVEAEDVEEAVDEATSFFEERLIPNSTFDYCKPMESGHNVAGADRWTQYEERPPAFRATLDDAKTEIETAFQLTKENFARQFIEGLSALVREKPEMMQALVEEERGRDEYEYEQFMGLLESSLFEDRIANPDRIEDRPDVVTEDDIEDLMYEQFSRLRHSFDNMGPNTYVYCYLYDTTYYGDGSGHAIDNVEQFEEILTDEHLDGKYVVPLDAHH